MRFLKCFAILLGIMIAGCGGGSAETNSIVSDTIAPVVSAFSLPATSTTLTVAISSLSASDAVGVTGYLVTDNSLTPSASASGWTTMAPTSFTFTTPGSKTAYAWAKDASGNVSASRSASITIVLPSTKTATLKFTSQITNPDDLISGFELTVILPSDSVLPTDADGVPLSGIVVFAGTGYFSSPYYSSALRKLVATYAFSNDYKLDKFYELGEFITISVTVPVSYEPKTSDIIYEFTPLNPSGVKLTTVIATPTFN